MLQNLAQSVVETATARLVCVGRINIRMTIILECLPDINEKILHFKYLINAVNPLFKQLHHDQIVVKEIEAKIQGVLPSEMEIRLALFPKDERVYCNHCSTSIVAFHRSCPNCSYDLCLACCGEIKEGCLQGVNNDDVFQYFNQGKSYLHGERPDPLPLNEKYYSTVQSDSIFGDDLKYEWKAKEPGDIPCPPKSLGGCGHDRLVLRCISTEIFVSGLINDVEKVVENQMLCHEPQIAKQQCSCFKLNDVINDGNHRLRKASSREDSTDNCLYCPSAREIQQGDLEHFQKHWKMGEPVIVSDVLESMSGSSWEPMVTWRAF